LLLFAKRHSRKQSEKNAVSLKWHKEPVNRNHWPLLPNDQKGDYLVTNGISSSKQNSWNGIGCSVCCS